MKEYIELYQKMREDHQKKWGSYYYPQNMQEFEDLNQRIFKNYLEDNNKDPDKAARTKSYIDLLLRDIKYFAYYIAFCEDDYQKLNDALWQNGRTSLLSGGSTHSGGLYTGKIVDGLLTCFACNDYEVIESFIPDTLPMAKVISSDSHSYHKNTKKGGRQIMTTSEKALMTVEDMKLTDNMIVRNSEKASDQTRSEVSDWAYLALAGLAASAA